MMRLSLVAAGFLVLFADALLAFEADLRYVDQIEDVVGSCFLQAIKLEQESPRDLTEPVYQGVPLYGEIPLAQATFTAVIDRSADGAVLYVDPDQSGILQEIPWEKRLWDGRYLSGVSFQVPYEEGITSLYRVILIWHPLYPIVLTYCRGGYREGVILLLAQTAHRIAVLDDDTDGYYDNLNGGTLLIDLDADGEFLTTSDSHELYALNEPFNIDGTVYQVAAVAPDGSYIRTERSDEWVPEKLPLEEGFPAPVFEGLDTTTQEAITLASLRGHIVLLDFWAGWCHPCIAELPTIKTIAAEGERNGVAVIGINLDRTRTAFEKAVAEHELTYRQIYDGREGPIGLLYRIAEVPMTYLIDREGEIYAKGLSGEELLQAIEELVGS